MVNLA